MRSKGVRPNKEVLGSLLANACVSNSPVSVLAVLRHMDKAGVKPDQRALQRVERFYQKFWEVVGFKEVMKKGFNGAVLRIGSDLRPMSLL